MFVNSGYIAAAKVREKFDFENFPAEAQRELLLRVKKELLALRKNRWERDRLQATDPVADLPETSRFSSMNFTDSEAAEIRDSEALALIGRRSRYQFWRYLLDQELFLSGPNEAIQPIDSDILIRNHSVFENDREWMFFSNKFLLVEVSSLLELIPAARLVLASMTLPKASVAQLEKAVQCEVIAKSLLPFEGTSLVVRDDKLPDFRQSYINFDRSDEQKARGRPRKIDDAAMAYAERFPDGHNGYTWKEVLRILEVEAGIFVSEDTLRKAVSSLKNPD